MNEFQPRPDTSARVLLLAAFALGGLAPPAAWAGEPMGIQDGSSQWGLGIGLGFERSPYREFDDKARVLPLILYENRYVSILGPSLDVKLPSAGPVSFRLRARYAGDGYEAEDSPYLTGMDERKASVWLGGTAIWRTDAANLSAELLADGSGNSSGAKFKLQLERRFASGAFGFTPRVSAQWLDKKYVAYYYGVRESEARVDRMRYDGRSAVNLELGLRLDYAIAPKQNLFVDFSAMSLGNGVRESPLVARSSSTAVRIGYAYRF